MNAKLGFLFLTFCGALAAQSSHGYFFAAPGGVTSGGYTDKTWHAGGGGEGILGKGVGISGEIGALGPTDCLSCVIGAFSVNGNYHFLRGRGHKVDPFVTTGYTLLFRGESKSLVNFGVGVNYWFSRPVGVKVEFRDHIYPVGTPEHFWGFRFGVTFRIPS